MSNKSSRNKCLILCERSKNVKHEFGNNLLVGHLRLKSILDKPQIKPNDRAAL